MLELFFAAYLNITAAAQPVTMAVAEQLALSCSATVSCTTPITPPITPTCTASITCGPRMVTIAAAEQFLTA